MQYEVNEQTLEQIFNIKTIHLLGKAKTLACFTCEYDTRAIAESIS